MSKSLPVKRFLQYFPYSISEACGSRDVKPTSGWGKNGETAKTGAGLDQFVTVQRGALNSGLALDEQKTEAEAKRH